MIYVAVFNRHGGFMYGRRFNGYGRARHFCRMASEGHGLYAELMD